MNSHFSISPRVVGSGFVGSAVGAGRAEEGRMPSPFFWKPCKCNRSLCCDAYLEVEAEGGAEEALRLLKGNRDTDVDFLSAIISD